MPGSRIRRLSFRLVLPTAVVTALLTATLVVLQLHTATKRVSENLDTYADLLGGMVLDGLREAMLADDRPLLEDQLARLSASKYVRRIDVVNKTGAVVFSSHPGAVGQRFDRNSESCTVCHGTGTPPATTGRTIRYQPTPGRTVVRFVQPIVAEADCLPCHDETEEGRNIGILVTDLDDSLLTARELEGARALSWTLAAAFVVLLVSVSVIVRFVVVGRLQKVKRLLEFVRAGARGTPRDPHAPDEIDEIERLVHSVAEDLEDRRALDRATESLAGVLHRYREPVLLIDTAGRVLGANSSFMRQPEASRRATPGQPIDESTGGLLRHARDHGWAVGAAEDSPFVAAVPDAAGRVLAFVQVWPAVEGEPADSAVVTPFARADPEWQLYGAALGSGIGPAPKRWRGVTQLDRRFTSGRRLLGDLASAAAQLTSDRSQVDLRSMILLVLWDIGRQIPGVIWHSLLEPDHGVVGSRYQLRALVRRLVEAAAAQARPGTHAVMFTQLDASGSRAYVGAWARSDEEPLPLDGNRGLPLTELLARNHGGGVEVNRAFDIAPLLTARGSTLPCDSRGVLFVAELAVDGGQVTGDPN